MDGLGSEVHARLLEAFPWRLPHKARRVLGGVGMAWFMLNLWAAGIVMGAGQFNWQMLASLAINETLSLVLLWQAPKRACLDCGGK